MANPEITAAFDDFNSVHDKVGHALRLGRFLSEWGRREVDVLGWDIRDCVGLLCDLHERALGLWEREAQERHEAWPIPTRDERAAMTPEVVDRWLAARPPPVVDWAKHAEHLADMRSGLRADAQLSVAYKTPFMLIRAYQDALARVFNFTVNDGSGRAQMSPHLKPGKPIGALLAARLPDYEPWYREWVKLRNQVKYGADIALSQIDGDIGVVFVGFPAPEGKAVGLTLDRTIFLRDVAEALQHSSSLGKLAVEEVAKLLDGDARAALAAHTYP